MHLLIIFQDNGMTGVWSLGLRKSKKDGKEQETMQSSNTPDPGYHTEK